MAKKSAQPLKLTRLGDPVLRNVAAHVSLKDVTVPPITSLAKNMYHTLESKRYGVGLAAPQIGEAVALAIIDIKPTDTRPDAPTVKMTIINPAYEGIGRRRSQWEGCLSTGTGRNTLYAKALRHDVINATWYDEHGERHIRKLDGIVAHVFQHETDHLNGVLFIDNVRDRTTFMLSDEYRRRIIRGQGNRRR